MAAHLEAQGRRLKAVREARSLTQEDAAHEIGVRTGTYGDWERGLRNPHASNWKRIEEVWGVDPAEIRGEPAQDQLDRIERKVDAILSHLGIEWEDDADPADVVDPVPEELQP